MRDDCVAETPQSVHSSGNPISHSTHVGFSVPPTTSNNGRAFRSIVACDAFPERQSREVGVGQCLAAAGNPDRMSFAILPLFSASFAFGVGHNPDAVPAVRCTNGGSRYAVPLRIVPERGQVSENVSKPPSKQSCDVFHDNVARSYLANKPGIFAPETGSFAGQSGTVPGVTDVLAGEPAAYDIGP